MIKLYICCLVLIIGSVEVGPDIDMKFHQEVMEIVSYDIYNISHAPDRKNMCELQFGGFIMFMGCNKTDHNDHSDQRRLK